MAELPVAAVDVSSVAAGASADSYLAEVEKKFEEVVSAAQKAGPAAINYLSDDLYIKAMDASLSGDSNTSALILKYVVKLNDKDLYLKKKYAIELIRISKMAEAQAVLEDAFALTNGSDESIGLILGGVYVSFEKDDEAADVYAKIINKHPANEEACVFLSKTYAKKKSFEQASSVLSQCRAQDSKNPLFPYYLGKITYERGNKELAKKYFKSSLKLDPEYYQAAVGIGAILEEEEKLKEATAVYKDFLQQSPQNYAVLSKLVQILFAQGRFGEITGYAEQLSGLDPSDLNLKVKLGILYTDAKRYEDAKGVFKEILKEVPDSDKVLYYLGAIYQETKDFEDAVKYYSKIPESSALFHDGHIQIGNILMDLANQESDKDKAKTYFDRLISFVTTTSKKYPALKLDLSVALAGFFDDRKDYTKAIEIIVGLRVDKEKDYNSGHDYFLASLYEKSGQRDKAIGIMEAVIATDPDNADALNFIGYIFIEENRNLPMAFEYITKASKLRPNDGYILDSIGWYYYRTGKLKESLEHIKRAARVIKDDAVINKHLAIIYYEMKMYDLSKKSFAEALKSCKQESEKEDVIRAMEGLEKIRLPASVK